MRARQDLKKTVLGTLCCLLVSAAVGAGGLPTASHNQLSFGSQAVGTTSAPVALSFTNASSKRVTIAGFSLSSSQFSYSGPALPFALSPGATFAGSVTFSPTSTGLISAYLVFTRTNSNQLTFSLKGKGVQTQTSVSLAPSIGTQPISQTILSGQSATFTATASGTAPLSYQWQKNGSAISGANFSSYTTPSETTAASGAKFSLVVSNSMGSVTSSGAVLTVNSPAVAPTIVTAPANQTVTSGQNATFSVVASGTAPLTYQWQINGSNISGASLASYTTPAETTANTGAKFSVVVSNSAGSITSASAALTVNGVTGALTTSSSSLSFGSVNVGGNGNQSVTLTNSGSTSISITGVSSIGAGINPSGVSSGLVIAAGGTARLNVAFDPASTGPVTGSVTVTSTASNPSLVISTSGTGVQASSASVQLSWTASTSSVSGYDIFRSNVSGSSYVQMNTTPVATTQYTDTTVTPGETYYYVVTAVSSTGTQSPDSNQVTAAVP